MSTHFQNSGVKKVQSSSGTRQHRQHIIRCRDLIFAIIFILMLAAFIQGCAYIKVRRVPTAMDYKEWTDSHQRRADAMEGFRFYLPRPFINVIESFPVATDIFIVNGIVSPDGQYVLVTDVRSNSPLRNYFASTLIQEGGVSIDIPKQIIQPPSDKTLEMLKSVFSKLLGAPSAQLELSPDELKEEINKSVAEAQASAAEAKESAESARLASKEVDSNTPTSGQAPTGINEQTVTNDNVAFAYQPLRGNFDIIYLPDFEEQYVVSSKSNLGNAQFMLNMGQGWSLQGFNSLVDNSEINKRYFDVIDKAMELGEVAASAALGVPPSDVTKALVSAATPRAQAETIADVEDLGTAGTEVTLKIVVVQYAAMGLYPVIKPRELKQQTPSVVVIDYVDKKPVVKRVDEITDQYIQKEIKKFGLDRGRFTIPVYPYQYISFNTFRYMAIEVLTKNGAPFGTLYDKTGTTDGPSEGQEVDLSNALSQVLEGKTTDESKKSDKWDLFLSMKPTDQTNTLNVVLASIGIGDIEIDNVETDPDMDSRKLEVTIKRPDDSATEITDNNRKEVKTGIEQYFEDVSPPVEITIK